MKVSVITEFTYNSAETVEDTIKSTNQDYKNIEYIIIDGLSKDNTLDIVDKYKEKISKVISEKDNGIYDAISKGILAATGDIVVALNSDDMYACNDVITKVVESL